MSDYFGRAILEDWLAEEVFLVDQVPYFVVSMFEQWREAVEQNIESWIWSDDGYGNCLSWRGWGRGFEAIPEKDEIVFDSCVIAGQTILDKS